jgi:DNA-binding beta-propeller fold protein YncE
MALWRISGPSGPVPGALSVVLVLMLVLGLPSLLPEIHTAEGAAASPGGSPTVPLTPGARPLGTGQLVQPAGKTKTTGSSILTSLDATVGPDSTRPSSVEEIGAVTKEIPVGLDPAFGVFDPANGLIYFTNEQGFEDIDGQITPLLESNVTVIQGDRGVASIPVGAYPQGIAYDPMNEEVYVSNTIDATVDIINGTTVTHVIKNVTRYGATCIAYDPSDQSIYVPVVGNHTGKLLNQSGAVAIIQGEKVVATVPTGGSPAGCAIYDPQDGDVYVGTCGGNDTVPVINGTKVVAKIRLTTARAGILAYDSANGDVYAAPSGACLDEYGPNYYYVALIRGTTVIANITISSGINPMGLLFDPGSGYMYLTACDDWDHGVAMVAINGSSIVGDVYTSPDFVAPPGLNATPGCMFWGTYDPLNDLLYVSAFPIQENPGYVAVVSTRLSIEPLTLTPSARTASIEAYEPVAINATLDSVGSDSGTATISVSPSNAAVCTEPRLALGILNGSVSSNCTFLEGGNATVTITVTDSLNGTVSTSRTLDVLSPLQASPIVASSNSVVGVRAGELGMPITFEDVAGGGTANYLGWNWSGLPSGECQGLATGTPVCRIFQLGNLSITVSVQDSNGLVTTSPVLKFPIVPLLTTVAPGASRSMADVGQSVTFTAAAQGGSLDYVGFDWAVSPWGNCSGNGTSELRCIFATPGAVTASVTVTDSFGGLSESPTRMVSILGLPTVTVTANRTMADLGQSLDLMAQPNDGWPPYSVTWTGLPAGACSAGQGTQVTCDPTVPGHWNVGATVTDSNAGVGRSITLPIVVAADPRVGVPWADPSMVAVGAWLNLIANVTGGVGPYSAVWTGLPPGCSGEANALTCIPMTPGTYTVTVTVEDRAGITAHSGQVIVVVRSESGSASSWSGAEWAAVGLTGGLLAAVAMAGFVVRRRRKSAGVSRGRRNLGRPEGARSSGKNRMRD